MSAFRCPNPSCGQLFDSAQMTAGAVYACPSCALQFQYSGAPQPEPLPPPPSAVDYGARPQQHDEEPEALYDATGGGVVAKPVARPRRGSREYALMFFGGAVALALFAAVGVSLYRMRQNLNTPGDARFESDKFNYRFELPPRPPWEPAPGVDATLQANLQRWFHSGDRATLALAGYDYGTRNPTAAELKEGMLKRLGGHFGRGSGLELEFEDKLRDDVKGRGPFLLGGQKALFLRFAGKREDVDYAGECYAAAHKGVGYWMFLFAPVDRFAQALPELDRLRERFEFSDKRKDWSEKGTASKTFEGAKGVGSVEDGDGIWAEDISFPLSEPGKPPRSILERVKAEPQARFAGHAAEAELALIARDKKDPKDLAKAARFLMVGLDGAGDPSAKARDWLVKHEKATTGADVKVLDAPAAPEEGEPTGEPPDPSRLPAGLKKLRLEESSSSAWFVVAATVPSGGKTLAAYGRCPAEARAVWENRILRLMAGVRGK